MSCKPWEYPDLDELNPTYETTCSRCGRPMLFVKATHIDTGKIEAISDDMWSQDKFFTDHMGIERRYKLEEEIVDRIWDFINDELFEWKQKMAKACEKAKEKGD